MCNKAVDNYRHALEFVFERYNAHNMCDTAVDTYPFIGSNVFIVSKYFYTLCIFSMLK